MGSRSLSLRALEQLYRDRHPAFARVAVALLGDRERAHDAVQDAFARAIRARRSYRGKGTPEAWVFALLVNVCRDEQPRREPPAAPDMAGGQSPGQSPVHVRNGQSEDWPELRAAVAELPERQRAAVFLRYFADLDYEAIAAGAPESPRAEAAITHRRTLARAAAAGDAARTADAAAAAGRGPMRHDSRRRKRGRRVRRNRG